MCRWGDPDGSPAFWIHGTPASRFLRHDEKAYFDNSLQISTYDRPGYGLSTRDPGRRRVDPIADVTAIADALGLTRSGVAGMSGGGPWALAAMAGLPDRVTRCAVVVCGITAGNEHLPDLPGRAAADNGERRVIPDGKPWRATGARSSSGSTLGAPGSQ